MRKDSMKTIGNIKDEELIKWANEKVGAKEPKIKNFSDPILKNSKFLLNLLDAIN